MKCSVLRVSPALMALVVCSCSLLASCGKHDHAKPGSGTSSLTDEDSLKYLMYRIMQVSFQDGGRSTTSKLPTYYWYNQVPSLDPFSTAYKDADALLDAMMAYPVNPATGTNIDRYSFLDRTGAVSNAIQNGVVDGVYSGLGPSGSLGMEATFTEDALGKSHLMILYCDKNSPAGLLGIDRGWEVTAINGDTAVAYDGPDGANVIRASNAIYGSDPVRLQFVTPKGATVAYTVTPATYNVNPILFDTIYTWNAKKVGYFAFYTFSSTADNAGKATLTKDLLDDEFDKLSSAGVSDLIVDLRYNGGGSVLTAEYMDNHIAPASVAGQLMYKFSYNDILSKNEGLLGLDPQVNFGGGGGLNLDHVFFIVSRETASASELTINNLKPYMQVKMVGDTTYGKPVGFIDFNITDYDSTGAAHYLADLYAINFATVNSQGVGGYFQGIPPDVEAADDLRYGWGDPADDNLSQIRYYLQHGSFLRTAAARLASPLALTAIPGSLKTDRRFNGMVDYRASRRIRLQSR